jgi:3-methyladenine DNA glycosylase AlkD
LKYKQAVNQELLFDAILAQCHSKEFFIKKACGWALREYSKVNSPAVADFISCYKDILSPLTIREGSKYLRN